MDKILNWGLLSTARINRVLIPPLRVSPRNRLLAVASRDEHRARQYAKEWEIPRAYGSYQALLDDPEIDVVYISLPNSLHAEWTIRAAQAGKHVLCEKPLALTLDEVDAMIAAARQARVVVSEAFMYRHHPQTLEIQKMVREGLVGKVEFIRGHFGFLLKDSRDVRWDAELGGGSLWDLGCYPVSYTRSLLVMEPEEVFGYQVLGESGVDRTFTGQMRFADGILAQFDSSFATPDRVGMEVVGNHGSLLIPDPFRPYTNPKVIIQREGKEVEIVEMPGADLYLGEIEDMADAILDGKPQRVSLLDSRANLAVLLALYESAVIGSPIQLAE